MAVHLTVQKGLQQGLAERPIVDGQISFTTDTRKIYLDHNGERLQLYEPITDDEIAELFNMSNIHLGDSVQL